MIDKREIIDTASRLGLNPHVVEKDFVLGWILAGIYQHPAIADSWVFKGGTCLKKCFFETYRFSEDLDFTLTEQSHIDVDFLTATFREVSEWVYENSGIELPPDQQDFDIFENPRGHQACQGKLSYLGPVSPRSGGLPRIKLDLTADEVLVLPPVPRPVYHPYSDAPAEGITASTYAYEETFGEKVRALAERTRPRDLYDVVNLFRNPESRPSAASVLEVLTQKCAFKGIEIPTLSDIYAHRDALEGGWSNMLAHQLPSLPALGSFWDELPAFFSWLLGGEPPVVPAAYRHGAGDAIIRDRNLRFSISNAAGSALETIRFAAFNRLCIALDYENRTRTIEPYSLRRTQKGDVLLHAFNVDAGEHRSYRIDRIQGARVTERTYVPRYEIELNPEAPVIIPPSSPRGGDVAPRLFTPNSRPQRARTPSRPTGLKYVVECTYCGRRFTRASRSTKIKAHKDKHGNACRGRSGFLVETKY